MDSNFEDLIFSATLCERADKYDEMIDAMKKVISLCSNTRVEQTSKVRNLFSVAYKNLAGTCRTSWRVLNTELTKQENVDEKRYNLIKKYMHDTEIKLHAICDDVIKTIDESILQSPNFNDPESQVFFLKMKGDYLRYRAEVCEEEKEIFNKTSEESKNCYEQAREVACDLKSTNPVRLGLALNFSVYLYEIAKDCKTACEVAKASFDEAIAGLDDLSEDHYKDSTLIMQLLRDNMTLWTNQEDQFKDEPSENENTSGENSRVA
ncbi:hypothetical protein GVAV_002929 [Gurleya vavrai]